IYGVTSRLAGVRSVERGSIEGGLGQTSITTRGTTMSQVRRVAGILAAATTLGAVAALAQEPAENMSFFVTSSNPGNGGDLGGLEGADAHCQSLAEAAGAGDKTWRAYLSTSDEDARDRIGDGPWYNAKGELIAENVEQLHGENNLTAETALT